MSNTQSDNIQRNPQLGTSVRYFSNCSHRRWEQWEQEYCDATMVPDVSEELLQKAAANMTSIREASLTNNPFGNHIVANLPLYSQLTNLDAYFLNFGTIWNPATTSLRTLAWTVPIEYYEEDMVLEGYLDFFMRVVEKTCPILESLDIHFETTGDSDKYPESYKDNTSSRLTSLRHFGVGNNSFNYDHFSARYYAPFVERYVDILESLDIPTPNLTWAQGDFDLLFGLCDKMPQLKSLKLTQFDAPLEGQKFLKRNLEELHPFIESISIQNIGCIFSPEIGKIFQNLKCLKYLRIGDEDDGIEGERLAGYEEVRKSCKFKNYLPS